MSIRFILLCSLLTAPALAAAALQCPASLPQGNKANILRDASVLEGDPAQHGELLPDNNRESVWTLPEAQWRDAQQAGRGLYLVCRYRGSEQTVQLALPIGTPRCTLTAHKGKLRAACDAPRPR
ncbi:hypothetical protein SAMN02745857_02892 [Andreprevotia lacus DSM 23236]|uniref:Uncharacterized protein n=1 Tax=Andreprevotia lacus DSM 23236 TaxID=1121001 RepID=A0A1W1XUE7_9NEIS|nr:STY0301 family protein [Andreprevotia lacus]SMC27516.1 hypothetical protein SAMN02745857_02892 [Andreprevotia lacus DSM 23236]